MRLINADKLPWVDRVILVDQVDGDINITIAKEHTSYVNDETPTVEAIPIDWIKKYVEDNTQLMINPKYENTEFTDEEPIDYYIKLYPYQINTMLREWEKALKEDESNI